MGGLLILIGFIIVFLLPSIAVWKLSGWGKLGNVAIYFMLAGILVVPLCLGTLYMTTGLGPNYGSGEVDVNIMHCNYEGIIWETYEIKGTAGEENRDFIKYGFSTNDDKIGKFLQDNIGKNVRIKYKIWLMAPAYVGNDTWQITDVNDGNGWLSERE
jgi:hypothetical protein